MSDFVRTYWVDNSAPDVTADELNRIEQGILDAHDKADELLAQATDAVARAAQMIVTLSAHLADFNNPHHVTAAQVGVEAALGQLAAHLADFNNPHQTTVDQVRAATPTA